MARIAFDKRSATLRRKGGDSDGRRSAASGFSKSINCGRIKRLISHFTHYYLFAIGLLSMRFDFERHKVIKSRACSIYAACMNVAVLASIPFLFRASIAHMARLGDEQLMVLTSRSIVIIDFVVITVLIVMRRQREKCFERMALEFYAIDELHFDRLPQDQALERYFERIYVAKFFTTVCQLGSNYFLTFKMAPELDMQTILLTLYFPNFLNFLHGVMFHYFATMWHGCKRFQRLNMQLRQLRQLLEVQGMQEEQQQLLPAATAELHAMSLVHWRLSGLVVRISDSYRCPILGVLLTFLLFYIVFGYYMVLAIIGVLPIFFSRASIAFAMCAYLLLLADLYLIYRMCDATTRANQHTSNILKEFAALPCAHAPFEREYEAFCLQLLQSKLSIKIGGMFSLNRKSLLVLWAFIIRHTIILLQYDFENRLWQKHAAGKAP